MKPTSSQDTSAAIQDYVKAVHGLQQRSRGAAVSTTALARHLGVTPGSVSAMVKRLAERGLVDHRPYRGVVLTRAGQETALEVIRRHRLLETFLAQELGMPWDRVHDEANALEHVVSDELIALIAAKLGHPERDPHGDPIPTADLKLDEHPTVSLASLSEGASGRFVQVSDADPAMLRYLRQRGIAPGDRFEVVEHQPFGGPLFARFDATVHALGDTLAAAMRVELTQRATSSSTNDMTTNGNHR